MTFRIEGDYVRIQTFGTPKLYSIQDREVRNTAVDLLTEILQYCKLSETRFQSLVREAKLRLEESKK